MQTVQPPNPAATIQEKGGEQDRTPGTLGVARPRQPVHPDEDAGKKRNPPGKEVVTE